MKKVSHRVHSSCNTPTDKDKKGRRDWVSVENESNWRATQPVHWRWVFDYGHPCSFHSMKTLKKDRVGLYRHRIRVFRPKIDMASAPMNWIRLDFLDLVRL